MGSSRFSVLSDGARARRARLTPSLTGPPGARPGKTPAVAGAVFAAVLLLALALLVTAAPVAGAISFTAPVDYPLGFWTGDLVAADFDRNGTQDLAAPDSNAGSVGILLGNGSGGFAAPVAYAAGSGPFRLAAGDFNGDRAPDLVAAGGAAECVLLNNGSGGFPASVPYSLPGDPRAVAVADVNGGGALDIVAIYGRYATASGWTYGISIRLGNGDGTFGAATTIALPFAAAELLVADLDRDGDADLLVGGQPNVYVLLNAGNGTLLAPVAYPVGPVVEKMALGDLTGDGAPDLAVANGNTGDVSVLLNNGSGGFGAPSVLDVSSSGGVHVAAFADFDGDGNKDLAVAVAAIMSRRVPGAPAEVPSQRFAIFTGDGQGGLQGPDVFAEDGTYGALVAADLDRDGRPDLAGSGEWDYITVVLNRTSVATPTIAVSAPTAASKWPTNSTQTVSWTLSTPVWYGEFRVWLVSTGGWYIGKQVLPVAGRTSYGTSVAVTCPAGTGYQVYVYWRPLNGSGTWLATARSAAFEVVLGPPVIRITSPIWSTSWPSLSTQTVSWTLSNPAPGGEFRVWLVRGASWYVGKQVLPVGGQTSYAAQVPVSVPAGGGVQAYVYWRPTVGSGSWVSTARSEAFTVTPVNITSPTAASVWKTGSTQTVTWTVNPPASDGVFRVWLVSSGGTWYNGQWVAVVPGQLAYGVSITLTCPAGTYRACVYYQPPGGGTWTVTARSPSFTVTP